MKIYLRILSVFYVVGALLHYLDLIGWRLDFSNMSLGWKMWIVFLAIADTIAAIGLWNARVFGIATFLVVAISQLVAYLGFSNFFGGQTFLIGFHTITLMVFAVLFIRERRRTTQLGRG